MTTPELNFSHICENAFLSSEGKLNIIGDFDEIKIQKQGDQGVIPFAFFVVTNFTVQPNTKYFQKIQLLEDLTNKVIFETDEIEQSTDGKKVGLLLRIDSLLPNFGNYTVNIILDKRIVKVLELKVSQSN